MQLPIELKQAIDNNAFCALATNLNEKDIQNPIATSNVVIVCFDFDNQKPVPVFSQILKDHNA